MLLVDAANVVGSRPDGWWRDRAGAEQGDQHGVAVRHASGEGDDLLAELCVSGVVLVTADRALRERAKSLGADVQGPRWLLAQLEA